MAKFVGPAFEVHLCWYPVSVCLCIYPRTNEGAAISGRRFDGYHPMLCYAMLRHAMPHPFQSYVNSGRLTNLSRIPVLRPNASKAQTSQIIKAASEELIGPTDAQNVLFIINSSEKMSGEAVMLKLMS